jgi:tetratricopeptide (TPR) repeat protein
MMKRLLIICLALVGLSGLKAQEVFVPMNFASLEKKILKSGQEITDPKKGIDPKTWIRRGEIMLSAYEIDLQEIYEGMSPTQLILFYKEPVITNEEVDGKSYEVYSYERIKFYFENKALVMWKKLKWAYENPLKEAYNSLNKASEFDQAGKNSVKLAEDYNKLKNQLKKYGINSYYIGNKVDALWSFELVLSINKLPALKGVVDTIMLQYAGIIARELNQTEKAIEHYKELAAVDHQPNTYLQIKEDYLRLKDTLSAITIMEKAFEAYPDTLNVVANLVDLYIRTDKIDEGLKTINAALNSNPDKAEFYYWKGRLQLNTTDEDRITKALESYDKAISKNPNLYYAYYDIGFIYFLQGQDLFTRAGDEKDTKFRQGMIEVATEDYQKALPNLEKALELNTVNKEIRKETLDTLKRVYYKLQMMDKYEEASEKLKNI